MDTPRPNFLGIGPGKAGTTWLFRILNEHPEVGLAAAKETLYFNREFSRGKDWYLRLFRDCAGYKAVGEVCNTYIFDSEVPARIYAFNPQMRLISCLRNPVDRAFSHYIFLLRNNYARGSFEEVLDASPELLAKGQYGRLLAPFFASFPRDQILILLFDDLRSEPPKVARRVFEFISVKPDFEPPSLREKVNAASRPRSRVLAGLVKKAAIAVRDTGHPEWVHQVKESRLARLLYEPIARGEYPTIRAATRRRLEAHFRDDVRRLSSMLGQDLETLWFSNRCEANHGEPDQRG